VSTAATTAAATPAATTPRTCIIALGQHHVVAGGKGVEGEFAIAWRGQFDQRVAKQSASGRRVQPKQGHTLVP